MSRAQLPAVSRHYILRAAGEAGA
eukprot:COSAG03_NODE_20348_length_320_cov_1.597285_2_plen_23_part_01